MSYLFIPTVSLFGLVTAWATPDSFFDRQMLSGEVTQATVSNHSATREVGEPDNGGYRTIWFSWTAPDTGIVTITLDGGDRFTKTMDIWMGDSLAKLKWVAAADAGSTTSTWFPVAGGTTYSYTLREASTRPITAISRLTSA